MDALGHTDNSSATVFGRMRAHAKSCLRIAKRIFLTATAFWRQKPVDRFYVCDELIVTEHKHGGAHTLRLQNDVFDETHMASVSPNVKPTV